MPTLMILTIYVGVFSPQSCWSGWTTAARRCAASPFRPSGCGCPVWPKNTTLSSAPLICSSSSSSSFCIWMIPTARCRTKCSVRLGGVFEPATSEIRQERLLIACWWWGLNMHMSWWYVMIMTSIIWWTYAADSKGDRGECELAMKAEFGLWWSADQPAVSKTFTEGWEELVGIVYQTLDYCRAHCQQIPPVLYVKISPLSFFSTQFITVLRLSPPVKVSCQRLSWMWPSSVKHKIQIWISTHLRETLHRLICEP